MDFSSFVAFRRTVQPIDFTSFLLVGLDLLRIRSTGLLLVWGAENAKHQNAGHENDGLFDRYR